MRTAQDLPVLSIGSSPTQASLPASMPPPPAEPPVLPMGVSTPLTTRDEAWQVESGTPYPNPFDIVGQTHESRFDKLLTVVEKQSENLHILSDVWTPGNRRS